MSIETVDTRARAAAAVTLVRHRAPEARPGTTRWLDLLVDPTKRAVVRTSGDPDRLDFAAALWRGTRA
jgi:hypothetical protein